MGDVYKVSAVIDAGTGWKSGINGMKSDLSGLDAYASKVGSAISTALVAGVAAAGVAISGALAGGTKSFMDFEQSMAGVSKTVDATTDQIKVLGESNRTLANGTGIAVTSLNGVSATLGSLGVAYKDIAATTDLVAKGSIAFGMDAEEMATKVSKISTVYKVPIEESGKYLSAMNALGNATAATEPQILSFTQAFGPMATMFNVPIEKVAAFGATLISSGVDAEEGATSIRSALEYAMNGPDIKMDDATKAQIKAGADHIKQQYKEAGKSTEEASAAAKEYENAQKAAFNAANPGNARMGEWARLLGTDVKTLNNMLNTDFLGTMAKSSAALNTIESSTDRSTKAFDIWGSYGFKVMGTMSSQAENLDANLKVVYADAANGSTSMTQEFNRNNDTLKGSFNEVRAGLNDIGISIGEITSGPLKELADWFNDAQPMIRNFVEALLSGDFSKVEKQFTQLKDTALKAFKLIAGAAGVGLVIKGMATIAPTVIAVGRSFVTMAATAVSSLATMAGGWAASALAATSARVAFIASWAAALTPVAGVVAGLGLVAAGLAAIGYALDPGKFTIFGSTATGVFNDIKSVVTDVWALIQAGDWAGVADQLKTAFGDAIGFVKGLDWSGLGGEVVSMIGDGASAIIDTAFKIGDWIYDTADSWMRSGGPKAIGKSIADFVISGAKAWFGSDVSIWDALKGAFGTVSSWATLAGQIAYGIGEGIYTAIYPYIAKVHNCFVTAWAQIVAGAVGAGIDIGNGIISGLNSATSQIKAILEDWYNKVADTYSYITSLGQSTGSTSSATSTGSTASIGYASSGGYNVIDSSTGKMLHFDTIADAKAYAEKTYSSYSTGIGVQSIGQTLGSSSQVFASSGNVRAQSALEDYYRNSGSTTVSDSYLYGSGTLDKSGNKVSGGTTVSSPLITDTSLPSTPGLVGSVSQTVSSIVKTELKDATQVFGTWLDGKLVTDKERSELVTNAYNKAVTGAGGLWDESIKSTASENAAISKTAAKEAADQTKLAGQNLYTGITSGADLLKQDMYGIGSFLDSITNKAGNAISAVTSTATTAAKSSISLLDQTSRNALTIGNSIVGSFTSGANAVQIGLNEAGQRIAVIGSVAQANAAQGGTILLGSISQGASRHTSAMQTGGQVLQLSALMSGQSLETGGSNAANSLTNAANKLNQWGGVGNVPYGPVQRGTNANVNLNGANVNLNGADASGNFKDVTCLGDTVLVNGLKYTSPTGVTTMINPMGYIGGGGIAGLPSGGSDAWDISSGAGENLIEGSEAAKANAISTSKTVSTQTINTGNAVSLNSLMTSQQVNQQTLATNAYAAQSTIASGQNFANTVFGSTTTYAATIAAINAGNIIGANSVAAIGLSASNQGATIGINAWNQGATVLGGSNTALSGTNTQIGATNTALSNTVTQLSGVNDKLSAQQAAITSSVSAMGTLATNIMGLANRGGGDVWGGTSISGGGSWIGTGSTMVGGRGYTSWGGTAASNALSASGYVGSVHIGRYARGGNPTAPTLALMAEQGEEMVLPHDITIGLKEMIATGGIGRQSIQLPNIEPADIVLDGRKIGEASFKWGTKGIQIKGDFSFR